MSSKEKYTITIDDEKFKKLIKDALKEAIHDLGVISSSNLPKDIGDINFAMEVTGLARSSIYNGVGKGKIPFHKNGKLYFSRKELEEWMLSKKTNQEKDDDFDITEYLK